MFHVKHGDQLARSACRSRAEPAEVRAWHAAGEGQCRRHGRASGAGCLRPARAEHSTYRAPHGIPIERRFLACAAHPATTAARRHEPARPIPRQRTAEHQSPPCATAVRQRVGRRQPDPGEQAAVAAAWRTNAGTARRIGGQAQADRHSGGDSHPARHIVSIAGHPDTGPHTKRGTVRPPDGSPPARARPNALATSLATWRGGPRTSGRRTTPPSDVRHRGPRTDHKVASRPGRADRIPQGEEPASG